MPSSGWLQLVRSGWVPPQITIFGCLALAIATISSP